MKLVAIMAKHPVPGLAKTRLASTTGELFAARLAEAFLRDLSARLSSTANQLLLAFTPGTPESRQFFQDVATPSGSLTWQQPEGTLGHRLASLVDHAFSQLDAKQVVIIGSDSPTLPTSMVEQAFQQLADHDVVLSPAADGGYVLIGFSRPLSSVFENIAWSTSRVLEQTRDQLQSAGASWLELPGWYDVDSAADLDRLRLELETTTSASGAGGKGVEASGECPCPLTTRLLSESRTDVWDTRVLDQ